MDDDATAETVRNLEALVASLTELLDVQEKVVGEQSDRLKQDEEALRESEERYRTLAEASPDQIFIIGRDDTIKYVNSAALKLFRLPYDQVIGKSRTSLFPPEIADAQSSHLKKIFETGERVRTEAIIQFGKQEFWLDTSWVPLTDTTGNVIAVLGVARDITERKRAEQSIRESELRYRTLIDSAAEGILVVDTETRKFLHVNPAICRMLGYSEEELVMLGIEDIHPKESLDYVMGEFMAVVRGEKTSSMNIPLLRKDKTIRYTDVSAARILIDEKMSNVGFFTDITERKRAEEALRETTEYLQNLFDHANAPIITWDSGFHITRFNHAFEHLTGRSQEEVLGKTLDVLFPDESRKASMALIQNTLVGERWETVEIPIFNIDGSTKTVLWNSANVLDSEGKLTATIAQGVDITDRKRADATLKVSEHKYRTLVENIPEKIFVKDALLAYVSCNALYARDLGIAAEGIEGKTDFDFYPRDLAEKYRADDRAVMESGATSTIDERYVLNGVESWVSTLKTPIRDNAGNISGILGIFHDITEKKRAEEELRESEGRYRTLAEASPDQIFIVGRDDTIKYVNSAALKLFRRSYDQVVGTSRKNLFPPDIADAQGTILKKVFETGEPVHTEEKIQFGTQKLWIDTSSVPLKDKEGNVTSVLGVARDITDRKRAEEALRESNDRFVAFIKEAAMRLKNPLEVVEENLTIVMNDIEHGESEPRNVSLELRIQIKNLEQIRKNIIELNKSIVDHSSELSDASKKFLMG